MRFHFYILYSVIKDKYYIGYTSDLLPERLRRHNSNHKGFTGGAGDWQLVYTEKYDSKTEAMTREREVKNWKSRKRLELLVGSAHPA